MFILEIGLASSHFSQSLSQISDDETSTEAHQERGSAQEPSGKIMEPWTFNIKFTLGTQFTFESLMFVAGEDEDLMMLPPGSAPERLTPVHGQASCFSATSSTSGGACSGLGFYVGCYICTAKLIRGILIMTSILWPLTGASSSSSSAASPDQDSSYDYPEIKTSTCGDSTGEGRLTIIVAPAGEPSRNSSSRYSTIGRSEESAAQTRNNAMIRNLNSEFNAVQL
jgi:hypothetical protein